MGIKITDQIKHAVLLLVRLMVPFKAVFWLSLEWPKCRPADEPHSSFLLCRF
jgi:hypothetical protein